MYCLRYTWPFNKMGLNCAGSLILRCFSVVLIGTAVLHDSWLVESMDMKEPQIQSANYKLYSGFQLCAESAPLTPTLFKDRLCIAVSNDYRQINTSVRIHGHFTCLGTVIWLADSRIKPSLFFFNGGGWKRLMTHHKREWTWTSQYPNEGWSL